MIIIEVPEAARFIIDQLNDHGFEAYVVGGCVRDSLLNRPPEDWDITTSAKPYEVKEIFKRTVDTGIQHGTVTVLEGKTGYEVTTFRIDGDYEDGRHPKSVEFTGNLLEDLKRRDFTINAMAYSDATGLVDAFGGIKDLENKVICCVGHAKERFLEDALRILRAVRFSAQLGFTIEEETGKAIRAVAPNLSRVSKERIAAELTKLLLSGEPEKLGLVYEEGISPYVSFGFHKALKACPDLKRLSLLPAKKHMRFAGFLRMEDQTEAVNILKDLKLDNETIDQVRTLVSMWDQRLPGDKPSIRRVMSGLSDQLYDDLLCFQAVFGPDEYLSQLDKVEEYSREIRKDEDCIRLKDMAVTGKDLIQAGMKPGPAMGEVLDSMFSEVLAHPEHNNREYLLDWWKAGEKGTVAK